MSLMSTAAATGKIDYTRADSNSIRWLLYERMVLDQLDKEKGIDLIKQQHLQWVASTVWPENDRRGHYYKSHFNKGVDLLKTLRNVLFPYLSTNPKDMYKDDMESFRREYARKFGDPSSPEMKAKLVQDEQIVKQQQMLGKQKSKVEAKAAAERQARLEEWRAKRYRKRG
jgi:hypothetical protein